MVGLERLELSTFRLATRRSIRLSYRPATVSGPTLGLDAKTGLAAYYCSASGGCFRGKIQLPTLLLYPNPEISNPADL
jgi:hypothetical protein